MRIPHHEQPPDDKRRHMAPNEAPRILERLRSVPLADSERLNKLVGQLGAPERLNGWLATKALVDSLGKAHDLYWADLGLQRPTLGIEHAAAVFDGGEIDYRPLFYDAPPEVCTVSRMTELLQDDGKVLSVAETGSNFAQAYYNQLVADNIIDSIDARLLGNTEARAAACKQAMRLLVGCNIVGGLLQGHDIAEELRQFQQNWPSELAEYRDDLMLASYLSDASAHSAFRLYRNARNGWIEPAVRPHDLQLTFLFTRHRNGAVTLTPDRCQMLLEAFPGITRLRHLLDDSPSPYAREDDAFGAVTARLLGTLSLGKKKFRKEIVKPGGTRDVILVGEHERYGRNATIITHFPDRRDFALERMHWLPGDGQVWGRTVWSGGPGPGPSYFGSGPDAYTHPDPGVTALQKNIDQRIVPEDDVIGCPLSPAEAWPLIHRLEKLR